MDGLFPHLEPHGFILKVNRNPAHTIDAEAVRRDAAYWKPHLEAVVGGWVKSGVGTTQVCEFAERVFVERKYEGFAGDRRFVENDPTRRFYSALRASIASVYAWRATHADSADERRRLGDAARQAYREAFVLYPGSPDAVLGFAKLLSESGLRGEALRVAETAAHVAPSQGVFRDLVSGLKAPASSPGR
jgi:hypothetical protein